MAKSGSKASEIPASTEIDEILDDSLEIFQEDEGASFVWDKCEYKGIANGVQESEDFEVSGKRTKKTITFDCSLSQFNGSLPAANKHIRYLDANWKIDTRMVDGAAFRFTATFDPNKT